MDIETLVERIMLALVVAVTVLVIGGCVVLTANSSSCARQQAMWESEYGYGVERTVTLYNLNGEVVEEWTGRIDVSFRDDDLVDLVFFVDERTVERRVVIDVGCGQLIVETAHNGG